MIKIKKGFTLIEIMVVVLILGLLSTLVIINVNNSRINGRDAKRVQDLDSINTAIQMYADTYNNYPDSGDAWWASNDSGWGDLAGILASYIPTLPKDPTDPGTTYYYKYKSDGTDYILQNTGFEGEAGRAKAEQDGGNDDFALEFFSSGGLNLP